MKTFILTLILQIFATNAHAIFVPEWDRPIAEIDHVEILQREGELAQINNVEITLTRNDSDGRQKLFITLNDQTFSVSLDWQTQMDCNTDFYMASDNNILVDQWLVVEFKDRSYQNCSDVNAYDWDVTLKVIDETTQKVRGRLHLRATIKAVFTIQKKVHGSFLR